MNRKILFKGKSINSNEWIESMTVAKGTIKRKSNCVYLEVDGKWIGIIPETLSEYIGKDDLFENSIVELSFPSDIDGTVDIGIIQWDTKDCAFRFVSKRKDYDNEFYIGTIVWAKGKLKTVGNIFDNADLLSPENNTQI